MAVYKATYCSPLLNSLDIRIVASAAGETPCEWLTCKIDSSNKLITGYKVRILDSLNNQIFPSSGDGKISPISELPRDPDDEYTNSGLNGTILKIPFFQNNNYSNNEDERQMVLPSFNAVYYTPFYKSEYVIEDTTGWLGDLPDWLRKVNWDGKINGDFITKGSQVLLKTSITTGGITCTSGIFKVITIVPGSLPGTVTTMLGRQDNIDIDALKNHQVVITKGSLHDTVYSFDSSGTSSVVTDHSNLWVDIEGNPINFDINGGSYKWEVTLYQGDGVVSTIITQALPVKEIVYDNLGFDWFDTVLNSGKILGSTNKRIQIASSLGDDAVLPLGTVGSPLVLQGTYIQLLDSNENPISNRAYVQNYDSTYGHVYPIAGGFSKEDINAAEKACFYKHSNNAEEVLARERVDYATTESDGNLAIYRQVSGRWEGNPDLGLPFIDGVQIKEDDVILVKNQERQCENGVYYAHAVGTAWSRSGSYKTWGDFIGATLLVVGGDTNGATNWESTAGAGGSLFDTNFPAGESPLFFIPEKPIILFYGGIKKQVNAVREKMYHELPNVTVETHGNYYKVTLLGGQILEAASDGTVPFNGQTILCYNDSHKIIEINSVTWDLTPLSPSVIIEYYIIDSAETGDYLDVLAGDDYGGHVVELQNNTLTIADEVKIAHILKNGVTHTYISPYIGLKSDMALKLLNNQEVTYQDSSVSNWIRIQSINTTVWRIAHRELSTPLLSSSDNDHNIPFSYEVRTFYRASDENPFSVYEAPYLIVCNEDGAALYSDEINKRYVTLRGVYNQFQQASWESYRWILSDYEGNILQDTGLKYDRDIKVTFYGLSNEAVDNNNKYFVTLYVVDDIGNELTAKFELIVVSAGETSGIYFSAQFDCSTHSMILSYQNNALVVPVIEEDDKIKPYVDDSYYAENGSLNIIDGKNAYDTPLMNIYEQYGSDGQSGLSQSVIHGINYSNYFFRDQTEVLPGEQELTLQENSAYFETEVVLDDNYCGKFLSLELTASNNSYATLEFNIPDNFSGGHKIENLSSTRNRFGLNLYKNGASVNNGYLYKDASNFITWYTTNRDNKFILQKESAAVSSSNEYHAFVVNPTTALSIPGPDHYLWYKPTDDGKYINSECPFGNACLVDDSIYQTVGHTAPMYWSENRGTVYYIQASRLSGLLDGANGINLTRDAPADGLSIPEWPSNDDDYRWVEADTPSGAPAQWDDLNNVSYPGSVMTLASFWKPMARHPDSLSGQTWRIIIRVNSIDNLVTNLDSLTISGDASEEYLTHLGDYATIQFIQILS